MVDKRPFVDRRLGVVLLFKDNTTELQEGDEDLWVDDLNDILDAEGFTTYVTDVKIGKNPDQMRVVLSESSISSQSISSIAQSISSRAEVNASGTVTNTEVVSLALSPGDKVRNTIGI